MAELELYQRRSRWVAIAKIAGTFFAGVLVAMAALRWLGHDPEAVRSQEGRLVRIEAKVDWLRETGLRVEASLGEHLERETLERERIVERLATIEARCCEDGRAAGGGR